MCDPIYFFVSQLVEVGPVHDDILIAKLRPGQVRGESACVHALVCVNVYMTCGCILLLLLLLLFMVVL